MSAAEQDPSLIREQRVFTLVASILALLGAVSVWFISSRRQLSSPEGSVAVASASPEFGHTSEVRGQWLADFELTERSGRTVSRAELGSQFLVLNLVFTSCSLGCQEVNRRMAEIQNRMGTNNDVRLISVSIDPRSDTPEAMARFAKKFHADSERWLFLTGSKAAICDLLEQSFFPGLIGEKLLIPNGLRLTQEIILIDPDGKVRSVFNGLDPKITDTIVAELERIRRPRVPL